VRLVAKSVRRPTIAALARCTSPDVERARRRRSKPPPIRAFTYFWRPPTFT